MGKNKSLCRLPTLSTKRPLSAAQLELCPPPIHKCPERPSACRKVRHNRISRPTGNQWGSNKATRGQRCVNEKTGRREPSEALLFALSTALPQPTSLPSLIPCHGIFHHLHQRWRTCRLFRYSVHSGAISSLSQWAQFGGQLRGDFAATASACGTGLTHYRLGSWASSMLRSSESFTATLSYLA